MERAFGLVENSGQCTDVEIKNLQIIKAKIPGEKQGKPVEQDMERYGRYGKK